MSTSNDDKMNPKTKSTFKLVFLLLLVDLLAFTLILPLLPKLLDHYAENDISDTYKIFESSVRAVQKALDIPESHNRVLLAGMIGSWFSLLQFLSSPVLGALSDRLGRRPIMILAIAGSTSSYVLWFMASNSFSIFVLSRTIGGLCKASVSLSLAIVTDVSNEKDRGKGMAIVGSSFSLAFIIGPLIGAYLTTFADSNSADKQLISYPASIAISLSLIELAIACSYLNETNKPKISSKSKGYKYSNISQVIQYINPSSLLNFTQIERLSSQESQVLKQTGRIYFYYLLFYSGLEFTLSFLTHLRFGFTSMQQGKLYLFSGILMAIIQGGYIRRVEGGKESMLALVGLLTIIPAFICMGLSTTISHIYFSLGLYSFSSSVVVPCLTTMISSHTPKDSKGEVLGTFRSIGALARAIGPCLAAIAFWTCGPVICYLGGALALLLPLYLMHKLRAMLAKQTKVNSEKQNKSAIAHRPQLTIHPAKAS